MAQKQETVDYNQYYSPQKDYKTTFNNFQRAGINTFVSPNAQGPDDYLDLFNILPAVNGSFNYRWAVSSDNRALNAAFVSAPVRMFPCQVSSETVGSTTYPDYYQILATDNKIITSVYNETGSPDTQQITGFGGTGDVYTALSRAWNYAFDGVGIPQKRSFQESSAQKAIGIVGPDATLSSITAVINALTNGPILLNGGRNYAIAFRDSTLGITSDVMFAAANTGTTPGASSIDVTIVIPSTLPAGVDTVVLLASSDGGDNEHLYEDAQILVSMFSPSGATQSYTYSDTLPDTYNDNYVIGDTLLETNLWSDVDEFGNTIGIIFNTPPTNSLNKPIVHQGRMFATDGKSVFFSKSLAEVTTSTGLITTRWEDCWPASNRLDIGFDNELITGLLSDTTFLYIGTTQNVYRLMGVDINSFSVECIFRNIGVVSQDAWTVVYKDGLPAGYFWATPDGKMLMSDFNTYQDVGEPVYAIFGKFLNPANALIAHATVKGPYSLVMVCAPAIDNIFIFNISTGGWYRWTLPVAPSCFQTYVQSTGSVFLSMIDTGSVFSTFNTLSNTGNDSYGIPPTSTPFSWAVVKAGTNFGDSTALKVINEVEIWSALPPGAITVTINRITFSPNNPATIPTPAVTTTVAAPLSSSAGLNKAFFAAKSTSAKIHTFGFGGSGNATGPNLIDEFTVEYAPFGRF